jgi:hypothetical protein
MQAAVLAGHRRRDRRCSPPPSFTKRISASSATTRGRLGQQRPLLRCGDRGHAPHPRRENARRKGWRKRGGRARLDLDAAAQVAGPEVREDLLALDEALTRLAAADPQAAHLVQLRYFAGLSIPQATKSLGISPRTADRLWAFAHAWLLREVGGDAPDEQKS